MVKLFQRGEASATVGVSEYLSWGLAGRVFLTPEGLTLSWSPSLFTARAFPVMTGNVILILYWTKQPLTSVNVWLLPVIWSVLFAITHASVDSAIVKNWDSRNLLSITVTEIKSNVYFALFEMYIAVGTKDFLCSKLSFSPEELWKGCLKGEAETSDEEGVKGPQWCKLLFSLLNKSCARTQC